MPTRNSWSSSSTSTCLPNLRPASPRRQSTQPAQPNRCSGDLGGGGVDSIQFFVRIGKVGLVQQDFRQFWYGRATGKSLGRRRMPGRVEAATDRTALSEIDQVSSPSQI